MINKKTSEYTSKPDFYRWKHLCLEQFNNTFSSNEVKRNGTIVKYIRDEIERIDTEKIDSLFCKLNFKRAKKIVFIHHYIEGEVNFSVQSFIFYNEEYCMTYSMNLGSNQMRSKPNCDIDLGSFESNYSNNGLLIVATFNDQFELVDNKVYYGMTFSQIQSLVALYS